jgi:hypothetical protein
MAPTDAGHNLRRVHTFAYSESDELIGKRQPERQ